MLGATLAGNKSCLYTTFEAAPWYHWEGAGEQTPVMLLSNIHMPRNGRAGALAPAGKQRIVLQCHYDRTFRRLDAKSPISREAAVSAQRLLSTKRGAGERAISVIAGSSSRGNDFSLAACATDLHRRRQP